MACEVYKNCLSNAVPKTDPEMGRSWMPVPSL